MDNNFNDPLQTERLLLLLIVLAMLIR